MSSPAKMYGLFEIIEERGANGNTKSLFIGVSPLCQREVRGVCDKKRTYG